ncbi:MAG: serine hydrolase domain-containing protein [Deinococcota bacterium]
MTSLVKTVDSFFSEWAKASSPGCAVAIMKDGDVIYKQGYGMANLEYGIPITPQTIFPIASVSKQFTAFAIALLADRGKLSLDDDIRSYLPEMHDFGDVVTIRHLIHHTSGLREQTLLPILAGERTDHITRIVDFKAMTFRQKGLNYKPGERFLYSNTNYTLLGMIVARISRQSLNDFCQENIFKPLSMHNTLFYDEYEMLVKNRAYSYREDSEGKYKKWALDTDTVGGTGIFTTIEDLALWDQNFYDAKVGGQDVITQMHTKGLLNSGESITYAFGLGVNTYKGLTVVEHSGGHAGFRSAFRRFPEPHFSVVILSNHGSVNTFELANKIIDFYLADNLNNDEPEQPTSIELSSKQLNQHIGFYYCSDIGSTIPIEMREGKLFVYFDAGYELAALSETLFYVKASPEVKYHFEKMADGSRQMIESVGRDKPTVYKLVSPEPMNCEQEAEYSGKYYSQELDVTYSILLQEDNLMLERPTHGRRQLTSVFVDGFIVLEADYLGTINLLFHRDTDDQVLGFKLSTYQARHIEFVKQN